MKSRKAKALRSLLFDEATWFVLVLLTAALAVGTDLIRDRFSWVTVMVIISTGMAAVAHQELDDAKAASHSLGIYAGSRTK